MLAINKKGVTIMTFARENMSAGKKAHHTAKWARTMTKWLITKSRRTGAKWNVVNFGGKPDLKLVVL